MRVNGPNVSLRYATHDDVPALFELGQDPEVTRFFSWGPYTDEAQPRAYVDSLARQREAGERLEFLIVDRRDRPLGVTGLSEFAPRDRRAVIGSWLGREHWGTGVNAESKALVLRLAFERLGLWRVTAWASPGNPRSVRALEKLGFVQEGVLRGWHVHRGEPRDVAVLRFMRDDLEASPLGSVAVGFEGEPPPAFVSPPG